MERPVAAAESVIAPEPGAGQKLSARWIMIGSAALVALVCIGVAPRIIKQTTLIEHSKAQLTHAPSVPYVVAELSPPVEEFVLPGTTQAILDAPVYARVDGYLRTRYADIGDRVHTGQVLAEIDTPELDNQERAAASAVEQARANLDNARQALEKARSDEKTAEANVRKAKTDVAYTSVELVRYRQLASQGAVSLEDRDTRLQNHASAIAALDGAQSQQRSAQAAIASANAAVHVAEAALRVAQSQHDQIAATRSFQKVVAPFDGTIVKRNVDPGALITSGSNSNNTILFELAKTDVLRIYAYVPEQYVPDVRVGEPASLTFQAFPGKQYIGTVAKVAGGLDPASKTLQVEIHVDNKNHELMPGMYAQVCFHVASQTRLVSLPATALQTKPDATYVYAIGPDNRVTARKVSIGRDLGGRVEITQGVAAGDHIILHPTDEITGGVLVAPKLSAERSPT